MAVENIIAEALKAGVLIYVKGNELAFKVKKGSFPASIKNKLKENKSAIIDYLINAELEQNAAQKNTVELKPRDSSAPIPLSYAQQRLWFLDQMEGANAAYHIPAAFKLEGDLSVAALTASLQEIVARHEVLRTVFDEQEGEPRQVVLPAGEFSLPQTDLSQLTPVAQKNALQQAVETEAALPFTLHKGPLLRGRLLKLAPAVHVFLVTMHHIIADAWSMGVLVREFNLLYEAYRSGKHCRLPPLQIQYADFAIWQRQWLTGEFLARQEAYWQAHLQGAPALLELPADRPRPPLQSYRGDTIDVVLGQRLSERVKALAQAEGLTLHMVLYAAWAILLSRLSGQEQVVVGTPVAGRQRRELEGLIGFFVNTLALRADLSGNPTVKALLGRVKAANLAAYAHQDIPFERVVEVVQPVRSMSHSPLFQVLFSLDHRAGDTLELTGLRLSAVEAKTAVAQFDLSLALEDSAAGIAGGLEYATDLFDRATVERWMVYYTRLVDALVANPQASIAQLAILPAAERRLLLTRGDRGEAAGGDAVSIHGLFETRARRHPGAVAAEQGEAQLTYATLNARANQLAHYLLSRAVEPGELVGLYLPRSLDFLVAMLGILKAGAAYVVLDTDQPPARLQQIRRSADLRLLVSCTTLAQGDFADGLCLDDTELQAGLAAAPTDNPNLPIAADSPAYAYFTSGSSGRPKGALNSHRGVVSTMLAMADELALTPADRVLQFAALGFDVVVEEIYPAWFAGATVVLRESDALLDAAGLQALLARRRITVCELMSGYWSLWLAYLEQQGQRPPAGLRAVLLGGDRVAVKDYRRFQSFGVAVLGVFGLTETGCTSLVYRPGAVAPGEGYLPAGRPLANTRVYVLDAGGQPVPVGVAGELYIGGAGVGLGYVGEPQLSRERFIADPFDTELSVSETSVSESSVSESSVSESSVSESSVSESSVSESSAPEFLAPEPARLFKTGDRVRWLPDATGAPDTIEFLGRLDQQIKLRGFRIELGDIEAHLLAHAAVREAAVAQYKTGADDGCLIAYVVVAEEYPQLDKEQLRSFLRTQLADYMMPLDFIALDAMPLTASGKIDRKALPLPDLAELSNRQYEAPATATETALAAIWQTLLGVETVGRRDNFFALGGHSLLAIRLLSMVQHRLGRALNIRALFENPGLAELAQQLDTAQAVTLQPITAADRQQPIPLSWAQQRLWFIAQLEGANQAYHLPAALRLSGALSVPALERTLTTLVARHEVLRTVFIEVQGEPRQAIRPPAAFILPLEDLSELAEAARQQAVNTCARAELETPFDLRTGPLFRARLLRLAPREHVLLVTMHHIVSDAWSMGVLVDEFNQLYRAYLAGGPDPLPPQPIQYADYAVWQRRWLAGEVLERQETYWQNHLQEAPALLALPTDRPRPAQQSYRGDSVVVTLAAPLSERLRTLANTEGLTLHMVLLAAWVIVLARLSGQQRIVVGTPVANRQRHELESLIGFFVNTLPLCTDLSGKPTVRELLGRVKALSLAGYAHQDVPFERMVEILQPARSMGHSPLFQVLFDLDHESNNTALELAGLQLGADAVETAGFSARFDLSLSLVDGAAGIAGSLDYATDLFDRSTIERWVMYFSRTLEALVADLEQPFYSLEIIPDNERQQLLLDGRHPDGARTAGAATADLVHALFEAQVRKHGAAPAVIYEEHTLSYRQLNRRANRLARYLMA
ncbi:amino acid adenylation domain-containing protein, partial [Exilibacterium tricleocarpae]